MKTDFMATARNAETDWEHDISGANKNGAKVYGTRVPLAHRLQEKRFRGLGLVAS
jgi:hypothetical protein